MRAVIYFEHQLKVCEAIGNEEGIVIAKANIALAKSMYEGGSNDELLKANQDLYELRVAECEEHEYTIRAGKILAMTLQDANRGDEARELFTKLLATSKQVFGVHHNITKEIESVL